MGTPSPPPPSRRTPRPFCTSARCRGTGWGTRRSGGGSPAAAAPPARRSGGPAAGGERLRKGKRAPRGHHRPRGSR